MKGKKEVDLSQKGTLEAFELSDDDMEQVNGGYTKVPVFEFGVCEGDCRGARVNMCICPNCYYK